MTIVTYCQSSGAARYGCAQAGCEECMKSLLRENRGLVSLMVRRQAYGKAEYADLFQEGHIGLWRAIGHYEVGRGVAFSSYACVVIEHQLWQAVRRSQKAEGWLECKRAGDSLEMLIEKWYQEQVHQALGEELEELPRRLREVIEQHYGLKGKVPQNLAQMGREWGLSRERMRQLHNEALALLRLPALSIQLRSLCERRECENYRQALRQNREWQRKVRGRR
jgi:RNA polymerase sigma factor (sigma-70 family)